MKAILFVFISLFSTALFAQTDLNGTWKAILIKKKTISPISQDWIINDTSIQINIIKEEGNKTWGTFSYHIKNGELSLQSEATSLSFKILERNEKKLIIENETFSVHLTNQAFLKESSIEIPYFQIFRMETKGNHPCSQCSFSFISNKEDKNYLLFFTNDSLTQISQITQFSDPNYQKVFTGHQSQSVHDNIIFENLNQDFITGFINGTVPFKLIPRIQKPIISAHELSANLIVQKGRSKQFQLTNKDSRTIFIGKEKLNLKEDGTGVYHYTTRMNLKNTYVSAEVEWNLSDDGEYLFTTFKTIKGDSLFDRENTLHCNIYHIQKRNEDEWELTKTLHKYTLW
jgi:hypothetical protein